MKRTHPIFCIGLALGSLLTAPQIEAANAVKVLDGVWIDPASATLVAMQPSGGIEAIDLHDGARRWVADAADVPLAIGAGTVLARGDSPFRPGRLPLALLDLADGRTVETRDLELPPDVYATVDPGARGSFAVDAWFSDGVFHVGWRRVQVPRRRHDDAELRPAVETRGAVALSWPGMAVTKLRDADLGPGLRRRFGIDPAPAEAPDAEPRGEFFVATRRPDERSIEVLRFDPATAASRGTAFLQLDAGLDGRYPSMDGRHFLSSRRIDPRSAVLTYRWVIHDLHRGDVVAAFDAAGPGGSFLVVGDRVVHVVRRPSPAEGDRSLEFSGVGLRGVRTADGVESWRTWVRDTRFRGTLPSLPGGGR